MQNDGQGSAAWILPAVNDLFAGHVSKDAVIAEQYAPHVVPWAPRATIVIYLWPETKEGRCGVVDLLHPSELHRPRCGDATCRCMQSPLLELDLFVYGPQLGGMVFPRAEAEQAAHRRIGEKMIMPGQLLHIVAVRLVDDPACSDGSRGKVVALCEQLVVKEQTHAL